MIDNDAAHLNTVRLPHEARVGVAKLCCLLAFYQGHDDDDDDGDDDDDDDDDDDYRQW